MKTARTFTRLLLLAVMAGILALTTGCGNDRKEEKDQPRTEKKDYARVKALATQLRQLDESLARMKQEVDAQQSRVAAVQADISAARQTLNELGLTYRPTPDANVIAAAEGDPAASPDPATYSNADKARDASKRRDEADNPILSTLIIILFIAAVLAIGYSLWHRRPGGDAADEGSTYTPEPSETPEPLTPDEMTPLAEEEAPSTDDEAAPDKLEPQGPPSAF